MGTFGRIDIIDKGGWRKEFPLSKSLIYIGNDPDSDLTLGTERSGGALPGRLQLLCLPGTKGEARDYIRIVNLGGAAIPFDPRSPGSQVQILHPWSAVALYDGSRFQLGDYTLEFHFGQVVLEERPLGTAAPSLGAGAPAEVAPATVGASTTVAAPNIGLELRLPETKMTVGQPLEGTVVVRNLGDRPAVQVRLALEGLDAESYELGPGPILFPNAQKEVLLRLYHNGKPRPSAGDHRIRISATAPQAYAGQKAEVSQVVHVTPFHAQELRFVEGEPEADQTAAIEIYNAGNVRSRFELRAEDQDHGLRYKWSAGGEPLVETGLSVGPAAPAPEPESPSKLSQVGDGVRKARGMAERVSIALNSVAAILPASVASPIRSMSSSIWQGEAKARGVTEAPNRVTRSAGLPRSQPRLLQATKVDRDTLPAWYQTPFVEPGERLVVSLRATPLRWYQNREYTIKITSRPGDQKVAESGAAVASIEKTMRISGLSWRRLVPIIVLIIVVIVLGLASWWLIYRG